MPPDPPAPSTRAVTACPLDCPDSCTLEVTVAGGRLVRVDAAPAGTGNPLTDGWICAKVRGHARRVHGPERVLTPLVRRGPRGGGSWAPVSWDEALDLVAERLRAAVGRDGPGAVVPYLYNSSAGELAADGLTVRLFRELGTSEVAHTICAMTAGAAWHQTFPGMLSADPVDVDRAALVVVWGANPSVANTHLTPALVRARRRGAPVVVIDPRRTRTAARADRHVALRPGTDAALGLAVAAELDRLGLVDRDFTDRHARGTEEYLEAAAPWTPERAAEVCGIDPGEVTALAELIGTHRPGMLRLGWGIERNRNGAAGVRAALATWVLAGQFGRRGAGVVQSTSGASPVDQRWPGAPARVLNMNRIGRDLTDADLDPRIEVLFVQGANPAATAPDQRRVLEGLAREDLFTVVHDQVMTDTAALADVVLPATTHFEADDVTTGYGSFTLSPVPTVIDRVGASRTNDEVAAALADRLGLAGYDPDPARRLLTALPGAAAPEGVRLLRAEGTIQFGPHGDPATTVPEGGRARLVVGEGPDRLPEHRGLDSPYPLTLLTPATSRTINTMFAEHDPPEVALSLHPDDAAARGVVDGQDVRVFNELAELVVAARLTDDVRPGVVVLPKGLWRRHVTGGLTANALVPDDVEATVGGACFNDARVEVARA